MRSLLGNPSLKPSKKHILAALANFQEFLSIRFSSPLFRLKTANAIQVATVTLGGLLKNLCARSRCCKGNKQLHYEILWPFHSAATKLREALELISVSLHYRCSLFHVKD